MFNLAFDLAQLRRARAPCVPFFLRSVMYVLHGNLISGVRMLSRSITRTRSWRSTKNTLQKSIKSIRAFSYFQMSSTWVLAMRIVIVNSFETRRNLFACSKEATKLRATATKINFGNLPPEFCLFLLELFCLLIRRKERVQKSIRTINKCVKASNGICWMGKSQHHSLKRKNKHRYILKTDCWTNTPTYGTLENTMGSAFCGICWHGTQHRWHALD